MRFSEVGSGKDRKRRRGKDWCGIERRVGARKCRLGEVRCGKDWPRAEMQAWHGET